jgi:hypothetical protein
VRIGELGAVVVGDQRHGLVRGQRVDHGEQVGDETGRVQDPSRGEGA